jgi:peptidoglycan/xylan/chitin deacetylase (PgdA/CDA1 family)
MSSKILLTKILGTNSVASFISSRYRAQPLVLLYHGVTKDNERHGIQNYRGKHVLAESFEKQLVWLKKHFEIVPLREIEEQVLKRETFQKPLCAITLDDGYKNNYEVAYPLLKKHDIPATIFITTGFIDGEVALWPDLLEEAIGSIPRSTFAIEWPEGKEIYKSRTRSEKIASDMSIRDRLKKSNPTVRREILSKLMEEAKVTRDQVLARKDYAPLSWDNIKEMQSNKITFGAHTETHPILSYISPDEQKKEITSSFEALQRHGVDTKHFAYPNGQPGDWNSDTKAALAELQIACAWTTNGMRVDAIRDNLFELPRITVDNTEDLARFRALASNAIPYFKKIINKIPYGRSARTSN